jgi:CubicO group peptidase (beta-lactamase class C family)
MTHLPLSRRNLLGAAASLAATTAVPPFPEQRAFAQEATPAAMTDSETGVVLEESVDAAASTGVEMPATWDELGIMKGFPPPPDKRVSKANWQDGPWNRWAFQHMREVFPTMVVSRGEGPVVPLPERRMDLGALPVGDSGLNVSQAFERAYCDAAVVLHNGELIWENYWNGMNESSRHLLMSVTKSFTGTLGGILLDRGVLDPNKTIGEYIPELKESGFGDATVRQAMDMEIDIEWSEKPAAVADPNSPFRRYLTALGFRPTDEVGGAYDYLPTMTKVGEPGEAFEYVSPVTDMFGWLLEKVTGKPYAQLLSEEIFSKLGAEQDGYIALGAEGKALTTGGLNLCARDLARFGQMMLQNGRFNGHTIVPESFVKDVRFGGSPERFGVRHTMDQPNSNYRSFWWVNQLDDESFEGRGIHGQHLMVSHRRNLVIARFSSYPVTSGPELYEASAALLVIANAVKEL